MIAFVGNQGQIGAAFVGGGYDRRVMKSPKRVKSPTLMMLTGGLQIAKNSK